MVTVAKTVVGIRNACVIGGGVYSSATETISTPRLILRSLVPADAKAIYAIVSNWNVASMLATVPWPYTLDDAQAYVGHARRQEREGKEVHFAIVAKPGNTAGMISLVNLCEEPRLGFFLAEEVWGRGMMSEALLAVCGLAFDRLHFDKLVSGVFSDNPGSLRVHEKCGFRITGKSREMCSSRGTLLSRYDLELTAEDRGCVSGGDGAVESK